MKLKTAKTAAATVNKARSRTVIRVWSDLSIVRLYKGAIDTMQIDCHHIGAIPYPRYRSSIPMILGEIRNFVKVEILDVTRVSHSGLKFFVSFYEKSYIWAIGKELYSPIV